MYLLNSKQEKYVLENTSVLDVWGIGSGLSSFLVNNKVKNAFQLTKFNEDFARKKKGIILLKTILELNGTLCNQIEDKFSEKNQYVCLDLLVKDLIFLMT